MSRVCKWWCGYIIDNKIRTFFHDQRKIVGPYVSDGMTVVDLGCGMGYFSLAMAKLINNRGVVVAVDLQQRMLDVLYKRALKAGVSKRIRLHRCEESRVGIDASADFALAFWMVHEVPDRKNFLSEVYSILKEGAKFLVAEPKIHVSKPTFDTTVYDACGVGFTVVDSPKIFFSRAVLLEKQK